MEAIPKIRMLQCREALLLTRFIHFTATLYLGFLVAVVGNGHCHDNNGDDDNDRHTRHAHE